MSEQIAIASTAPLTSAAAGDVRPLHCSRCDVAWRGTLSEPCWCCGSPGAPSGDIRRMSDDP
ncbi:MAG: hypothetical protein ACE5GB_02715 [Acidimicrobiales bacterium]